jgi:hypothetical protein
MLPSAGVTLLIVPSGLWLLTMLCTFIISLTGKMAWHLLRFSQALNGPPTNAMISKYGEVPCMSWILLCRMERNCLDGNLICIMQFSWESQRSMPPLPHWCLILTLDTSTLSSTVYLTLGSPLSFQILIELQTQMIQFETTSLGTFISNISSMTMNPPPLGDECNEDFLAQEQISLIRG